MSSNRSLIPYSLFSWPREQFGALEDEFSQLTNWPLFSQKDWPLFSQKDVQLESDEKNFYVSIPVPGLDPSEVEISIHHNTLYIKAEHNEEKNKDRRTHIQATRSYSRVITLPEQVDENNVSATTENGLLNIQLPKITKTGSKKIQIRNKE